MYWHPAATARAARDAGLKATIGGPLFDAAGDGDRMREEALGDLEELAGFQGAGIGRALSPHAIYTASEGLLRWAVERAAEHAVPLQIHLSETAAEVEDCVEAHGVRPAAYLDRLGFLTETTLLAHGVHLDEAELELIASRGCTVVTNPVANMKLAVGGVFPYPEARRAGVSVGLGTDGPGSNNSLDLLSDVKAFALLQKHSGADPTVAAARESWRIATGMAAPLLGATALETGAPADFLLLRPGSSELAFGELEAGLVYAASGSIVDTTVVAGNVLMRGGEVPGEEEVIARALERARRLDLA
jgi:5-methylthioadenosine/S-adenosylhomocysteine deaminase